MTHTQQAAPATHFSGFEGLAILKVLANGGQILCAQAAKQGYGVRPQAVKTESWVPEGDGPVFLNMGHAAAARLGGAVKANPTGARAHPPSPETAERLAEAEAAGAKLREIYRLRQQAEDIITAAPSKIIAACRRGEVVQKIVDELVKAINAMLEANRPTSIALTVREGSPWAREVMEAAAGRVNFTFAPSREPVRQAPAKASVPKRQPSSADLARYALVDAAKAVAEKHGQPGVKERQKALRNALGEIGEMAVTYKWQAIAIVELPQDSAAVEAIKASLIGHLGEEDGCKVFAFFRFGEAAKEYIRARKVEAKATT